MIHQAWISKKPPRYNASRAIRQRWVHSSSGIECAKNTKGRLTFVNRPFLFWCPRRDSNPHTSRHMDLNHARLPIPPRGLRCKAKTVIIDSLKALSTTFSLPWHHFRCNTMPHPCFAPVLRLGKWPQLRYTRHIRPPGRASPWHL